jgi:YHS domain-containing protein
MKKIAIALIATAVASFSFAGGSPKTIKCAVMPSMKVEIEKATKTKMFTDYKGRRYFFCCAGCPDMFKKNPTKYAKNDSIPVPKKK